MKKFLMLIVAMLFMSVASFSQITISQEDYDRLPGETRTQIEKITTEKAIKGEIKEVSEYASLGKEIGVAVNETLKAVEAKLQAEMIVPAQKQKERVTIEAEAIKAKAVLEVGEEVVPLEDFEKEFKFSLQDLTNWWNKKILELE